MRSTRLLFASAAPVIAIASACAGSDADVSRGPEEPLPAGSDGGAETGDAPVVDADVPDTRLPDCSAAGWCITAFPDADLVFRDIAPFEDVAFAVAESETVGVRILEWTKSTNEWRYIDDGTQNQPPAGAFAGGIYAPSTDEVFATVGTSFVFHGRRSGSTWTWTKNELPDSVEGHSDSHGNPVDPGYGQRVSALGVWGTSADDVYAFYGNAIYQRDPVSGSYAVVYEVDDLDGEDEHVFFTTARGSGPSDVWFVGARVLSPSSCSLVVRKSAAGWERVADGVVSFDGCAVRGDTLLLGAGWLIDLASTESGEVVALQNRTTWGGFEGAFATTLRVDGDGYAVEETRVPIVVPHGAPDPRASSLWRGAGETWYSAYGLVLQAKDDEEVAVSTLSRTGGPVAARFHRIRGTSNQNLWTVGSRHAYHKTTP